MRATLRVQRLLLAFSTQPIEMGGVHFKEPKWRFYRIPHFYWVRAVQWGLVLSILAYTARLKKGQLSVSVNETQFSCTSGTWEGPNAKRLLLLKVIIP